MVLFLAMEQGFLLKKCLEMSVNVMLLTFLLKKIALLTMEAYLSALYLYNSESGFSREMEKSSEITLIAPSMERYSAPASNF